MTKKFKCADLGMKCGFVATADTVEQLMSKIASHATEAHGITDIPKETLIKVQAATKDI